MEIRKQFRAPWDYLLIIITISIVGLLLGLNYLYSSHSVIPTILTWGIILGCATFGVYGYSIQNRSLRILRLGWSKDILLSDITSVEHKPNAGMGSIRIAGIGVNFKQTHQGFFSCLRRRVCCAIHRGLRPVPGEW